MRWEDGVDQDMRILEVKNWKKVALDRDEWAKLLKKAGPTMGCKANDDEYYVLCNYFYLFVGRLTSLSA
jgi:hypothetical protein